uniref:SAC domain-containing protein n=1 Tax=Cucumis melo TaxID=3656 RepID=A0A9I9CVL8_CUCME
MEGESSSCERFKLYDQLELHEFQDRFVVKSVEFPNRGFSINRGDGNIEPLDCDTGFGDATKVSTIYGVVGTIRLVAGVYMLVITSRKEVGNFLGFPVFQVTSMKFLPCDEALKLSTSQEITSLSCNSLQRRCKFAEGWTAKPLWKQADPRFVWNKNLLVELIEFKTEQLKLKESPVQLTLISRRCTRRLGTRMWRRGANLEGDTANFIETEQLVEHKGLKASLLQIRGSIPLLWEQIVDLSYKPQLKILNDEKSHGEEGQLSAAFAAEMQKLPNARYLLIDPEGNILQEQKGVIRSNCIDCLDRTNVTQCFLAQKSLTNQLQRIGLLTSAECITNFNEDYTKFRTYGKQTFSGVIKDGMSAITRYYLNNFHDGVRQDAIDLICGRYSINKQGPSPFQLNGFESLSVSNDASNERESLNVMWKDYLPVASALVVGGLTITSLTLQQAGRNAQQFMSSVLWAGVTAGVMAVVKANGKQFCSRPRLCSLR